MKYSHYGLDKGIEDVSVVALYETSKQGTTSPVATCRYDTRNGMFTLNVSGATFSSTETWMSMLGILLELTGRTFSKNLPKKKRKSVK